SPNLEADGRRRPTDFLSSMDSSFSAVEHGNKPVTSCRDFAAAEAIQHGPHRLIVPAQQVAPGAVAELNGTCGGVHDVGDGERRTHAAKSAALRPRERRTRLPIDCDPRLVPHYPGVVAGRNLIELAVLNQQLRTLTHPDPCAAGDA